MNVYSAYGERMNGLSWKYSTGSHTPKLMSRVTFHTSLSIYKLLQLALTDVI